jgi:tetratricopeptide (TPR) repeat protein
VYKNAEVYYNLGNCYYKLNNISKSILSYERALNLAPGDEDIQHNLKLANLRITDKIQPVPQMGIIKSWNSFVASNSSHGWTIWSVAFAWIALLLLTVYLFVVNRRVFVTFGVLVLVLCVSTGLLAYKQNAQEHDSNMAILTSPNVFAKSAPDENGNNLFMLNEGTKFCVLDEVGTWEKIRLADGRVGWIEKGSFERI